MTAYALGIDLGTSGVKVAVLDLSTFKLIALAMQGYDNSPHQPSTMLWEATAATIREAAAGIDVQAIQGISLSGQMHGTVLYDAQGEVIDPIINWQDKRCDIPLAKYDNRSTVETMMERLAGPEFDDLGIDILASGYLGATLFHIKENEPALLDRIATWCCRAISSGQSSWACAIAPPIRPMPAARGFSIPGSAAGTRRSSGSSDCRTTSCP